MITAADFTPLVSVGVTVSGRVTKPANLAAPIIALLGGPAGSLQAVVSPNGSFQFQRVHPGTYTIEAPNNALKRPVTLTVGDDDISGLELAVVSMVNLSGVLVIEGGALRPKLNLSFIPYEGGQRAPIVSVDTNGMFITRIPEGEYRVSWSALPQGYVLKSIRYGSTNLLSDPLKPVFSPTPDVLVVTLGITAPPPGVKVSGRVRDTHNAAPPGKVRLVLDPTQSVTSMPLATALLDTIQTVMKPDGFFEFPMVPSGTYTVRVDPSFPAPPVSIVVGNNDVSGANIVIPAAKEVKGRVFIEGRSALSPAALGALGFSFTLKNSARDITVIPQVQSDGTFKATFPEGERHVVVNAVYPVKSITDGATDLLTAPLRIAVANQNDLHVTLVAPAQDDPLELIMTLPGYRPNPFQIGVRTFIPEVSSRFEAGSAVCLSCPLPDYPSLAKVARVADTVVVSIVIAADGKVKATEVTSGHTFLQQAAAQAVRAWRFIPRIVDGKPTEDTATVAVEFTLK
jgi:TonB family protein